MRYQVEIIVEENGKKLDRKTYKNESVEPLTAKALKEECLKYVSLDIEKYEKVSDEMWLRDGRSKEACKDEEVFAKVVHERPIYFLKVKDLFSRIG